jgi:hypothetical protein
MSDEYADLFKEVEEAARITNAQVSKISSLSRLKDDEIRKLCPKKEDAKKLAHLIKIVKEQGQMNKRKVELEKNIKELSGIAIKLITKFVL